MASSSEANSWAGLARTLRQSFVVLSGHGWGNRPAGSENRSSTFACQPLRRVRVSIRVLGWFSWLGAGHIELKIPDGHESGKRGGIGVRLLFGGGVFWTCNLLGAAG